MPELTILANEYEDDENLDNHFRFTKRDRKPIDRIEVDESYEEQLSKDMKYLRRNSKAIRQMTIGKLKHAYN